jgi:hypothetical protein
MNSFLEPRMRKGQSGKKVQAILLASKSAIVRLRLALVRRIVIRKVRFRKRKIIMNRINPSALPEEDRKFPVAAVLISVAIFSAAAAILVFKVPISTVLYFGFFGFMILSHFFMHGGHGAHGGHNQDSTPSEQNDENVHPNRNINQISEDSHVDGPAQPSNPEKTTEKDSDSHKGHSGCC